MSDELNPNDDPNQDPNANPQPGNQNPGQKQFASINDVDPDELNRFVASKKRNLIAERDAAVSKAASFDKLEGTVRNVLDSGLIDDVEDLEDFAEQARTVIESHKTAEQKATDEAKKTAKQRDKAIEERDAAILRYNSAQIKRQVADDGFDLVVDEGGLEFLQLKLEPLSEVQADGSVLVNWTVTDEDGKRQPGKVDMRTAIEDLEAQAKDGTRYRGFFKSSVQGGPGGGPNGPNKTLSEGGLDEITKDAATYMKAMRENPEAVKAALANVKPFA